MCLNIKKIPLKTQSVKYFSKALYIIEHEICKLYRINTWINLIMLDKCILQIGYSMPWFRFMLTIINKYLQWYLIYYLIWLNKPKLFYFIILDLTSRFSILYIYNLLFIWHLCLYVIYLYSFIWCLWGVYYIFINNYGFYTHVVYKKYTIIHEIACIL